MIYPTFNFKAVSCYARTDHGAIIALTLFLIAARAALAWRGTTVFGGGLDGVNLSMSLGLPTLFAFLLLRVTLKNAVFEKEAGALRAANRNDYEARA